MKATLLRAYACAPEGHTVIKFMAGEIVEGIVARMALSDGAAVSRPAFPVTKMAEAKRKYWQERREKEGGKIVGKKLSADRLAKMMLGQKLYWQKKREAAEHDI